MTRRQVIAVLINVAGVAAAAGLAWAVFGLEGRVDSSGVSSTQVLVLLATVLIGFVSGLVSSALMRPRRGLLELPTEILKSVIPRRDGDHSRAAA